MPRSSRRREVSSCAEQARIATVGILYTSQTEAGLETGPQDARGTVSGNTVSAYQKNGIVIRGRSANVTVKSNTVTGAGMVDWIAQNGIEYISEARGLVQGNTVTGNWYTPKAWVSCGLLFYQAGGVKQQSNNLFGNEANLCNAGRGGGNYRP